MAMSFRLLHTWKQVNNGPRIASCVVLSLHPNEVPLSQVLKMLDGIQVRKLELRQEDQNGDGHWADFDVNTWTRFTSAVAAKTRRTLKSLVLSQSVFVTSDNSYESNRLGRLLENLHICEAPMEAIKLTCVKHNSLQALRFFGDIQNRFPNLKTLELTNKTLELTNQTNNGHEGLSHDFAEALAATITGLHRLEKIVVRHLVFAEEEKSWTTIARAVCPRGGLIVEIKPPQGCRITEPLREILGHSGRVNIHLFGYELSDVVDALIVCHRSVNLMYLLLTHGESGTMLRDALSNNVNRKDNNNVRC